MGKQALVDKTIHPLVTPLQTQYTPMYALGRGEGSFSLGYFRGNPAFIDLDKLVVQPLVWAEQQNILGILDGRLEGYDLKTLAVVAGENIGTVHTDSLTVPTGDVWFLNAVVLTLPASGGANIITGNWRCNLWPDNAATPNSAGQAFHAADVTFGVGGGVQPDEFGPWTTVLAIANKTTLLRLPGGTVIMVYVTNTVAAAAGAVNATLQLYGFRGKALVT